MAPPLVTIDGSHTFGGVALLQGAKLTHSLDTALDDTDVRKRLAEIANDIPDKSRRGQKALQMLVKSEIARWTPIIKAANIKVE